MYTEITICIASTSAHEKARLARAISGAALFVILLAACAPGVSGLTSTFQANPVSTTSQSDPISSHSSSGISVDADRFLQSGSSASIVEWGHSTMSEQFDSATVQALKKYGQNLLKSNPGDIESFCPTYGDQNADQRLGFWTSFFSALSLPESSFHPTSISVEKTMGRDPVTGQQVASEGLLQISYQDEVSYRDSLPAGACDFDFKTDQQYPRQDIRRSIQNPAKNLNCGVAIMNLLVSQDGRVAGATNGHYVGGARYWSTLRHTSTLNIIRIRTKRFCEEITK